jgi:hypothetical protein
VIDSLTPHTLPSQSGVFFLWPLGQVVCRTPEEFKAWSQNLGHDKVLTTFLSYGQVESRRQGEIIRGLATPQVDVQADVSELAKALVREMRAVN